MNLGTIQGSITKNIKNKTELDKIRQATKSLTPKQKARLKSHYDMVKGKA